jgi:hypothetical protein
MKSKQPLFSTTNKQQLVSLLLVAIALVSFTASFYLYQASKPKVYEYGIYQPGTPVQTSQANVIINTIHTEKGSGSLVAPQGQTYLLLNVTFKNTSDKTISVMPSTQTYIKTADGTVYYMTPLLLEHPFRAGDLKPGDMITGEVSYLVPENTSYTMYIDSIWSGGVVSVRLT